MVNILQVYFNTTHLLYVVIFDNVFCVFYLLRLKYLHVAVFILRHAITIILK